MLMSLISLSDEEIETVTSSVREWCQLNHHDIDSSEGRRAITAAVELVQTRSNEAFLDQLIKALESPFDTLPETSVNAVKRQGSSPRRAM